MPILEHLQPILAEFKRGLQATYGGRLQAVSLPAFRARGATGKETPPAGHE